MQDIDQNKLDLIKKKKSDFFPTQFQRFKYSVNNREDTRACHASGFCKNPSRVGCGRGAGDRKRKGGLTHVEVFPLQHLLKRTNLGTAQGFRKERKHLFD